MKIKNKIGNCMKYIKTAGLKRIKTNSIFTNILAISLVSFLLLACGSSKKLTTKQLFMQYDRVSITHLQGNGENDDGGRILHEQGGDLVNLSDQDNTHDSLLKLKDEKLDTSKVYHLSQFLVTTKAKFSPVKDGFIEVDFLVNIPKSILSDDWQIALQPVMMLDDSVTVLDELYFKGENFAQMQAANYDDYDGFISSIIDSKEYDKHFLDQKLITKEMEKRQKLFFKMYSREWKQMKSYLDWKTMMTERYNHFNIKGDYRQRKLQSSVNREYNFDARHMKAIGKDTTGMWTPIQKKLDNKFSSSRPFHSDYKITTRSVPKKFRELHENNLSYEDIRGHAVNERDSIEIADYSYKYDQIAENEFKMENKDDAFHAMVPFMMHPEAKADSVVSSDRDIVYHYRQSCPLLPGLHNVKLTMRGYVNAIDRSGYTMPPMDTLTFVVSSLDQLVDTTLISKKTTLHRNMFDKIIITPEYDKNDNSKFIASLGDNAKQVDSLITRYEVIKDMGLNVDSICLVSYTGLDGSFNINGLRATDRLHSLKDYMKSEYSSNLDVESIVLLEPKGEDWNGLVRLVRQDNAINKREQIIDMIREVVYPDEWKKDFEEAFPTEAKYLKANIYPQLERIEAMFYLTRPNMEANDSLLVEFRSDYAEGVRLLQERQYWEALEFLANYPDYNAALNLLCLNYDQRAYDLLKSLAPTGGTHYLLAIASYRLNLKEEAAEHLIEACRLDPSKIYRAPLDHETQQLINEFGLTNRLYEVADKAYEDIINKDKSNGIDATKESEDAAMIDNTDSVDKSNEIKATS